MVHTQIQVNVYIHNISNFLVELDLIGFYFIVFILYRFFLYKYKIITYMCFLRILIRVHRLLYNKNIYSYYLHNNLTCIFEHSIFHNIEFLNICKKKILNNLFKIFVSIILL
jgi:hypothetical protein